MSRPLRAGEWPQKAVTMHKLIQYDHWEAQNRCFRWEDSYIISVSALRQLKIVRRDRTG